MLPYENAAGYWFEFSHRAGKRWEPRLDDKGRLIYVWKMEAFKRVFQPEILAHEINIKCILAFLGRDYIGYASNIKCYEFASDGEVIKIYIELNNGVQPDTKIYPKSQAISGLDGDERADPSMAIEGPEEISLSDT